MNVLKYFPSVEDKKIVFCIVDNTRQYTSSIRELVKNQADGVLSNLYNKQFNVLVWIDEDELLRTSSDLGFEYAVVLSTGTEFINGHNFFSGLNNLLEEDFFIAGHILDRQEAYYELHHQCYVINLKHYKDLDYPKIGRQELFSNKLLTVPLRSEENYHDDYTPLWIKPTNSSQQYRHCCHGWNFINLALKNNLNCIVFNDKLRNNKIFLYPESINDFNKQVSWVYARQQYCQTEFVHKASTDLYNFGNEKFEQIITPASGDWFVPYISTGKVIYYDYNQKSLDYWKEHCPQLDNVIFEFVKCDLLGITDFVDNLDPTLKTLVNLSNIFNYEGTYMIYSQSYRQYKQDRLIENILKKCPEALIHVSIPATVSTLVPTWHL